MVICESFKALPYKQILRSLVWFHKRKGSEDAGTPRLQAHPRHVALAKVSCRLTSLCWEKVSRRASQLGATNFE
jgi:hypothetical protein